MKIRKNFPHIKVSGTPYEIGRAYGEQLRQQIQSSIDCYRGMFLDFSGISWETATRYAHTFIPTIEHFDPDIMEEIRGCADGSGFPLDEILALNVRSEIVMQGDLVQPVMDGGCTSCSFTPYKTETGETWIGQNWDWKPITQDALVVLEIQQENKPDIVMITEAGIVGKIGFNSAGIGVCLNALATDRRWEGETVPLHIALRAVLNSTTLADAIENAGRMPLACCANFMMAGAQGQAVTVEIGPGEIDVIYADEGWVAHSNHFYGPRTTHIRDTGRMAFPDTYLRLGRVRETMRQLGDKKISVADIQTLFEDHVGYPDSICRHVDPRDPIGKQMHTDFSILMNLDKREMLYAAGCPCTHEYSLYRMERGNK